MQLNAHKTKSRLKTGLFLFYSLTSLLIFSQVFKMETTLE